MVIGLICAPSLHTDTTGGSLPAHPHLPTAGPIQTRSTPCWPLPPSQKSWQKSPVRRQTFKGQESLEYSPSSMSSRPVSAPVPAGALRRHSISSLGIWPCPRPPDFSRWSLLLRPGVDAAAPRPADPRAQETPATDMQLPLYKVPEDTHGCCCSGLRRPGPGSLALRRAGRPVVGHGGR